MTIRAGNAAEPVARHVRREIVAGEPTEAAPGRSPITPAPQWRTAARAPS